MKEIRQQKLTLPKSFDVVGSRTDSEIVAYV